MNCLIASTELAAKSWDKIVTNDKINTLVSNKCTIQCTKHTTCRQILPHCFVPLWHAHGRWRRVVRFTLCWWAGGKKSV